MDPNAIYNDLKQKIIWLDLEPGAALNLVELAQSYGVSRNPVMIALARLASEEWVVRQGVHFVVSPLTIDRMREITEIRSVMETQANVWAMDRMTAEGLAALRDLREEIKALGKDVDRKEIVGLDFKFHRIIYRQTRNHQLARLLERLLCHYLRFWLSSPGTIDPVGFFNQALEIIDAIEANDEALLRKTSAAHIKVSLDTIMGLT
jgi:DNA-binding GntR family transcriptional regulator